MPWRQIYIAQGQRPKREPEPACESYRLSDDAAQPLRHGAVRRFPAFTSGRTQESYSIIDGMLPHPLALLARVEERNNKLALRRRLRMHRTKSEWRGEESPCEVSSQRPSLPPSPSPPTTSHAAQDGVEHSYHQHCRPRVPRLCQRIPDAVPCGRSGREAARGSRFREWSCDLSIWSLSNEHWARDVVPWASQIQLQGSPLACSEEATSRLGICRT